MSSFIVEQAQDETREITAQFGTATVCFSYYPNRVTGEWSAKVAAARKQEVEGGNVAEIACELLASVINAWDVRRRKGEPPMPVTKESLMGLPTRLLSALLAAILQDANRQGSNDAGPGGL